MADKVQNTVQANEATKKRKPVKQDTQALARQQNSNPGALQRAVADPSRATPEGILALQRTYGNQAVSKLLANASQGQSSTGPRRVSRFPIQAKLTVGPVNDKYEQEADQVAKQVTSSLSNQPAQRQGEEDVQMKPLAASITPLVQRQGEGALEEEEEELTAQTKPLVQRQGEGALEEEEEELTAQTKLLVQRTASDGSFEAGDDVEQRLTAQKGGGSPLPDQVRSEMEAGFGTDFSGVRVHTGSESVQLNRDLQAQAFTHGQDIHFGSGKFDPSSSTGKELLAHELTHVVQQTGGGQSQRKEKDD